MGSSVNRVWLGVAYSLFFLARKGRDVTGFDVAEDGLRSAAENAARAGTKITTVKARFEDFDYGTERWDLIYFVDRTGRRALMLVGSRGYLLSLGMVAWSFASRHYGLVESVALALERG